MKVIKFFLKLVILLLAVAATLFGHFLILVAGWWVYTAPLSSDPAGYTQAVLAAIFSVGVTWLLFKFVVSLALKSLTSLLDVINTTSAQLSAIS